MKLVFATNNKHKLEEISHLLEGEAEIGSLAEIGCQEDIPEDHDTLEENALQKARYIKEHYGYDCFADDTGLEIEALDKRPGVYSARYAGPAKRFCRKHEESTSRNGGDIRSESLFPLRLSL